MKKGSNIIFWVIAFLMVLSVGIVISLWMLDMIPIKSYPGPKVEEEIVISTITTFVV